MLKARSFKMVVFGLVLGALAASFLAVKMRWP